MGQDLQVDGCRENERIRFACLFFRAPKNAYPFLRTSTINF
jgi:hypothetical protein